MKDPTPTTDTTIIYPLHPMPVARPRFSVSATIGALGQAIGQAAAMAYVAPYQSGGPSGTADTQIQGRDPRW
jgi:hypothetical protein